MIGGSWVRTKHGGHVAQMVKNPPAMPKASGERSLGRAPLPGKLFPYGLKGCQPPLGSQVSLFKSTWMKEGFPSRNPQPTFLCLPSALTKVCAQQ